MKARELIKQLKEWDRDDEVQVLFSGPGSRGLLMNVESTPAGSAELETQPVIRLEVRPRARWTSSTSTPGR